MDDSPLTDREEIALALLLWRSLRADFAGGQVLIQMVAHNIPVTEHAHRLALLCDCRKEFYELMVRLPVFDVKVTNLDGDGKRVQRVRPSRAKKPKPPNPAHGG